MSKKNIYFLLLIGALIGAYFLWYPRAIYSVDELSYATRAMAFADGKAEYYQSCLSGNLFSLSTALYPLGTSTFLAMTYSLYPAAIFLNNIIYLIVGMCFIRSVLVHYKLFDEISVLPIIAFLPLLFFARSLMSEMPSFALTSIFCWVLFTKKDNRKKMIFLGFIMGLCLWFREANIVLLAFLIAPQLRSITYNNAMWLLVSFLVGILPRLLSAYFVYDNGAYVYDYPGFSIEYAMNNLSLYGLILLFLLPGGLIFLILYQGPFRINLILGLIAYILLHIFYRYNATGHSGLITAIFYNGRYIIPSLPLWALIYAWHVKNFGIRKVFVPIIYAFTITGIFGLNFIHSKIGNEYSIAASTFYNKLQQKDIFIYTNSAYRMINPLYGDLYKCVHINAIHKLADNELNQDFIFVQISRSTTQKQIALSQSEDARIAKVLKMHEKVLENEYAMMDGSVVKIWRFKRIYDS